MIKKVLDALEALVRALPEVDGLQVSLYPLGGQHFTVSCATDEKALQLAEELGQDIRETNNGANRWLTSYGKVTIYGPHHPYTRPAPIDELRLNEAVEHAHQVAASEASS